MFVFIRVIITWQAQDHKLTLTFDWTVSDV